MKALDQKTQALDDFVVKGDAPLEESDSQLAVTSPLVINTMGNVYQKWHPHSSAVFL